MGVVRRGLVIPFQLAGFGIEGNDGRRIKVVALALVAVVVGAGIAGRPIEDVELGVEGAREPGDAAGVFDRFSAPSLRAGLAGFRDGPEAPNLLASLRIPCGDKTARSLFAARCAGYDESIGDEGRGGGVVVLLPIRHFGFPGKFAGETVEGE